MCAVYVRQKKWDRVLKYGLEALEIEPGHKKIRYRLGLSYMEVEDFERAENVLNELREEIGEDDDV